MARRLLMALLAAAALAAALHLADVGALVKRVGEVSAPAVLLAVALHAMIVVALGLRWRLLLRAQGCAVTPAGAVRLTFGSTAMNLVLPGAVGGDVGRVLMARGAGVGARTGVAAALADRAVGLVALVLVVIAGGLLLAQPPWPLLLAGVLVLLGAVGAWPLLGRMEGNAGRVGRLATALRRVGRDPARLLPAFGLSLACHLAAAAIAAVLAVGLGIGLSGMEALMLFPAVLLAAMIPVGFGGWGVRELAAIPLLAPAGVTPEGAVALALLFGLTQLAAASMGALASLAGPPLALATVEA